MIGYTIAGFTMMRLGSFSFGINTAAYNELRRSAEYKWPAQERFGQYDALQFTGPGQDSITLTGVILTAYRGGTGQLDRLRALAAQGRPQMLVSGLGATMGRWVIERVEEGQTIFAAAGIPRRQEFTLSLRKYDNGVLASVVQTAAAAVGGAAAAAEVEAKTGIAKLAEDVSKTAGEVAGKINETVAAVREKVAEIGQAVAPVISTATRAVSAAYAMKSAADNLRRAVNGVSSIQDVPGMLGDFMSASTAATNAAADAAGVAEAIGAKIGEVPGVQAVRDCAVACGQAAVAASNAYGEARKIIDSVRL